MTLSVRRLDPSREDDFLSLHCEGNGLGWCRCVAWWTPTWEEFKQRSEEENLAQRRELWSRGEHDGYLLYEDERPVAWCQVGPRDRLVKLVAQYDLLPDPDAWAVTCVAVAPAARRRGLASHLLEEVLADLRRRGVRRVEGFPKRGAGLEAGDLWTGPEELYRQAGFVVVRDDASRPVLARALE